MFLFCLILVAGIALTLMVDIHCIIFPFVTMVIWIIIQYCYRFAQIASLFCYERLIKDKKIYQEMADEQLKEFKTYLFQIYPDYEKEIFEKIKIDNVNMVGIHYPEIKSNETIMELVSLINKKITDVYNCDLRINAVLTTINERYYESRAWCIPGVVKKSMPKNED